MIKKVLYLLTIALFFGLTGNIRSETNIEWELMQVPDFVHKDAMQSICSVDSLLFVGSVSGTIDSSGLYKYNLITNQWGKAFINNKMRYVANIMRDEIGNYLYVYGSHAGNLNISILCFDKVAIRDYTYTRLKKRLKNDVGWWGDVKDNGKNIALVGLEYDSILFSSDYGVNWHYSHIDSQATAGPRSVLFNKGICYVASTDYFGNQAGGVYRSTDSCKTWQGPFVQNGAGALAVDSQDRIYLGIQGGPLYYTDTQFATWTNSGYGEEVNKIHVTTDDQIFAGLYDNGGTHGGILYSTDRGISWSYQCNGLPENATIVDITEDDNGYIYLIVEKWITGNTYHRWLYRSKNPLGISNSNISTKLLKCELSSFPNPFNPTTTIKFDLPASSQVKLAVYDVTGRQISILANGILNSGTHSAEFNGAKLASGVYFYQLEAEGKIIGRNKMMLLK